MSLDTWGGGPPTAADVADTDAWLWRVMQSDKNKAMIARLEDSLCEFVHDDRQNSLPFPPRNAFHRKVCYLVARRYGLAHRLEEYPDALAGPVPAVRLVLIKTPHSAEPAERLAQLADRPPAEPVKDAPARLNPVAVQNAIQEDDAESVRPAMLPSTTFLRRPRTAEGRTTRVVRAVPGSASQPAAATLRSISEEDYRKARARIFKNSEAQPNERDQPEQDPTNAETTKETTKDTSKEITKIDSVGVAKVAKGPVEGSLGFERRRNRRDAASQNTQTSVPGKVDHEDSSDMTGSSTVSSAGESNRQQGRTPQVHSRGPHFRNAQEHVASQSSVGSVAGSTGPNNNCSLPAVGGSGKRQNGYPGSANCNNGDLQDPDFDRRYDKWAVRRAPHPPPPHPSQQIPVPIFSQLLYPYAVQASAPHMHPSALHLGSVSSNGGQGLPGNVNVNQYQSLHVHHAPAGAVMFQQLGQGIAGLGAEYGGRSVSMPDHISPYDMTTGEQFGTSLSREMSTLQRQAIPPPVPRKPSPAYGLDSTVDFPPLP